MADKSSESIHITRDLAIPRSEIRFQFSRSGGPGGQNVNRRQTRAELLFDLQNSPSLSKEQRARLLKRLANKIDRAGILHVVAHSRRSQLRNRQKATKRFVQLLRRGLQIPRRRLPTQPSQRSIQQRLARKRRRGEVKRLRQHIRADGGE